MKVRIVSAAAVLVLAATTLTACRTNVGTAATVSGHRISESKVSDYVLSSGPTKTASAAATDTVAAKPVVLQYLVLQRVYREVLVAKGNGGLPTATELASVHDDALQLLLQSQVTGSAFDSSLREQLAAVGIKSSLAPIFLQVQELEYTLVKRRSFTGQTQVAAAIKAAGVTVRVNPRYGAWDAATGVVNPSGGTPGYLKLQTSASATPAAGS